MVSLFWSSQTEIFRRKRDLSKGSPNFKYQTENVFTICKLPWFCLSPDSLGELERIVLMVYADPNWVSYSGVFAYHLKKPSTSRFLFVHGKQPHSLHLNAKSLHSIKIMRSWPQTETLASCRENNHQKTKNISSRQIIFLEEKLSHSSMKKIAKWNLTGST